MPNNSSIWVSLVCETCGKKFDKLLSQMAFGRQFCGQQCHYNYVRPIEDRFWEKVEKSDGCWLWIGQKSHTSGYGRIDERKGGARTVLLAHRVSWELHFGQIMDGLHVLHKCDNPPCVNPDHLFLEPNAIITKIEYPRVAAQKAWDFLMQN